MDIIELLSNSIIVILIVVVICYRIVLPLLFVALMLLPILNIVSKYIVNVLLLIFAFFYSAPNFLIFLTLVLEQLLLLITFHI